MYRRALELLACPKDRAPLILQEAGDGEEFTAGSLRCDQCGTMYRVAEGIGSFLELPTSSLESELLESEVYARDKGYSQVQSRKAEMERLPERDAIRKLLGSCKGHIVLDAGCGQGPMLSAARGAAIYCGIDYSRQGLTAFPARPVDVGGLVLTHGDVRKLPFRTGVFDTVFSAQVLEHVPTEEGRMLFLAELARVMKPTARMVITAYNWHEGRRAKGIPKEGMHPSGIFYHCYEPPEFRLQLEQFFHVDTIWGGGVTLPGAYRLSHMLGRWNRYWDRLWWNTAQGLRYGEILMARCFVKRTT